jgi:hypothetical protein
MTVPLLCGGRAAVVEYRMVHQPWAGNLHNSGQGEDAAVQE